MGAGGGTLTDLTNAVIRSTVNQLNGQVMTRPALIVGDAKNLIYACDVNVGVMSANGRIDQQIKDLYGVPGTRHYNFTDSFTVGTILRNVPLAPNNQNLRYADVGNGVYVTRTASGQWQVTGFSVELPGTRTRYALNLSTGAIGPVQDLSLTAIPLTLGQLATVGPGFGLIAFGATATYLGGVLVEINA